MGKKVVSKKIVSNEDLARMVSEGFLRVDKQFKKVDERFTNDNEQFDALVRMVANSFGNVDRRFIDIKNEIKLDMADVESHLSQKIGNLEKRIDDVVLNRTTKDEVYALSIRVDNLEIKTGLKGKKKIVS